MYLKKYRATGLLKLFVCTVLLMGLMFAPQDGQAQRKRGNDDEKKEKPLMGPGTFSALKLRGIGPAFASGRIADFAVNPNDHSEFFVGVASGNLWKTTNKGITFKPVFEKYGSYSIGCITYDPTNPLVLWLGTGENNHQRALAYGDGVYKSTDGGENWENMGLKESRHIGKILVDPRNPDVVFVAAEGSAWGPGGQRGLYKTTDGGENWEKVLEISENTGINNVVLDPRNPDVLYATSEQRRRHVYTKIGGGPESAVYKSTDGGKNWDKIMKGLPGGHIGGMGIAISPVNPDYLYLIMEAANDKGGFFRTTNRGASWQKMSSHHSSGQYYNEIFCDPQDVDKVYSMETYTHITTDGGKTWQRLSLKERHVDDHAFWIDPQDTDHFIIGGDGGVYITYDAGENFYHVSNLPVTQFYRVAVDNAKPFYNVYGGTQDNNSMGGPSQTLRRDGITNEEWTVTLGGDGFWQAIDPENPDIVYSEYQYGNVFRYDKKSGEALKIKPTPPKDSLTYKWNWNAPFIISPHDNERLYMAANKVFRSDDRGNSWDIISPDITAQIDRNRWKVMGKYWSVDAVAKDVSTSLYGMAVSLDESPVQEGLLYAGTDDGVIQVTEDGQDWRKAGNFPGVPEHTYVSDIYASQTDANVVFAAFDNRKRDDFTPYILKSTNKGRSWTPIANNLPENGTVHAIEQDDENPDLLFAGTEFGVFFSNNGGQKWIQLKNGIPTIAVRDLAIQRREDDLAMVTFGRGFYILDDYSPLRTATKTLMEGTEGHIFPVQDALMYIRKRGRYGQGSTYYKAKNPEFGATFTYYLKETPKTQEQLRHEKEKELFEEGSRIPQPSWKAQEDEDQETSPYLVFTVYDKDDNVVRHLTAKASKGIHRIHWDLEYPSPYPVQAKEDEFAPLDKTRGSVFVMPGTYKVGMQLYHNGTFTELAAPQAFEVKALENTTLPAPNRQALVDFQKEVADWTRKMQAADDMLESLTGRINHLQQAILSTPAETQELMKEAEAIEQKLYTLDYKMHGVSPKASREEIPPQPMPLMQRLSAILYAHYSSTAAVTQTEKDNLNIIKEKFPPVLEELKSLKAGDIKKLEEKLEGLGAPHTPGRIPETD